MPLFSTRTRKSSKASGASLPRKKPAGSAGVSTPVPQEQTDRDMLVDLSARLTRVEAALAEIRYLVLELRRSR